MKYRLKKDLPFAKAGAEVEIGDLLYVENWAIADKTDLKKILDEGWIEEIKPREFVMCLVNGRSCDVATPINPHDKIVYVKVREIID